MASRLFQTILCLFVVSALGEVTEPEEKVTFENKFGIKHDEAIEAIFSVAIRLEALLTDANMKTSKNFLVSPLSMAVAVGELMLGAGDEFRDELYDLLVIEKSYNRSNSGRHLRVDELEHASLHEQLGDLMQSLQQRGQIGQSYTLKTTSVMFARQNLTIKKSFIDNVLKYYGTKLHELDFENDPIGCEAIVNNWVSENTNGLIKSLLSGPLPRKTSAILANAVYFRGEWEIPFASEINRRGVFKISQDATVNVTYMQGEFTNYRYVDSKRLNCRMVIIPYQHDEVSMYIIMPNVNEGKEYNINEFVRNLGTKDVNELTDGAKLRKVTMLLPKMALSNTISMIEPLKRYHKYKKITEQKKKVLNSIAKEDEVAAVEEKVKKFGNQTRNLLSERDIINLDLNNISDDPNFQISNIYQQMTLSVNEKGTEAAAISAGVIDYIMDSVVFRVDRPFLFFIRHENTQATLFWGTIVDPTENSEL